MDRLRPAGAETGARGNFLERRPIRMAGDVLDDDPLAGKRRRAAGADADPDRQAVHGLVVKRRQAGRDAVAQVLARFIELQDAAQHAGMQFLDPADDRGKDRRQRLAMREHFEHAGAEAVVQELVAASRLRAVAAR